MPLLFPPTIMERHSAALSNRLDLRTNEYAGTLHQECRRPPIISRETKNVTYSSIIHQFKHRQPAKPYLSATALSQPQSDCASESCEFNSAEEAEAE